MLQSLLKVEVPPLRAKIRSKPHLDSIEQAPNMDGTLMSTRRNYVLTSLRKDALMEWMKDMLNHSFVLDAKESYAGTMGYFETLIEEHRTSRDNGTRSRLKEFVPTVGTFHTPLPMSEAFKIYDLKYSISKRRFISPTFNEIRHILNLSQVMAIGPKLQLITFDGDQTLYTDGGNFEENEELALAIISLMCHGVKVAVVTAAGYGLDGSKYEKRLRGLLDRFVIEGLTKEQVENFYVFGGECNYLLQCTLQTSVRTRSASPAVGFELDGESPEKGVSTEEVHEVVEALIVPVPVEAWQAEDSLGPKPAHWPQDQITTILDVAEKSMRETMEDLQLRVKILRKERAIGIYPGGTEMVLKVPVGHGSAKVKREALDELVLRVMEALRVHTPRITLPYCVFNGGTDAWLDIGNKRVGVEALQAFFKIPQANCLHVGDQFLNTGNDIAARETCPCIWIVNPRETGKVLQYVIKYGNITPVLSSQRRHTTASAKAEQEDLTLIGPGVVPGTAASLSGAGKSHPSSSHLSRPRSISGELGKLCVYTGNVL